MSIGSSTLGNQLFGSDVQVQIDISAVLVNPVSSVQANVNAPEVTHITAQLKNPVSNTLSTVKVPTVITAKLSNPVSSVSTAGNTTTVISAVIVNPVNKVVGFIGSGSIITAALRNPVSSIKGVISVTADKLVLVVNIENSARSEYTNFPFDSVIEFPIGSGKYYGAIPGDGVYILEGADDAGTPIDTVLQTGLSDYGDSHLKNIPIVYLGCELDGKLQVRAVMDKGAMSSPQPVSDGDGAIKTKIVRLPLGPQSRYWGFEIRNYDDDRTFQGGENSIDTIESEPATAGRR